MEVVVKRNLEVRGFIRVSLDGSQFLATLGCSLVPEVFGSLHLLALLVCIPLIPHDLKGITGEGSTADTVS